MSIRVEKKLNRLNPVKEVLCYLRAYDAYWNRYSSTYYASSKEAEKDCHNLNRSPYAEFHYRVECESV